jgi:hypothetical protein
MIGRIAAQDFSVDCRFPSIASITDQLAYLPDGELIFTTASLRSLFYVSGFRLLHVLTKWGQMRR